jgi:hypothetical protein
MKSKSLMSLRQASKGSDTSLNVSPIKELPVKPKKYKKFKENAIQELPHSGQVKVRSASKMMMRKSEKN